MVKMTVFFIYATFGVLKFQRFFFGETCFYQPPKKLVAFMIQIADHQGQTARTTWILIFLGILEPPKIYQNIVSQHLFLSEETVLSFQVQRSSSLFGVCLSNVLFACVRRTAFAIPSTNSRCVVWPRFKISLPRV